MLVTLVINRAGQADFPRLGGDGEETAGIDKEAVDDWFLLEGHGRCDQEAEDRRRESVWIRCMGSVWNMYIFLHR